MKYVYIPILILLIIAAIPLAMLLDAVWMGQEYLKKRIGKP